MSIRPELSVIVPFYNAEYTLKRCLDSIFLSCEEIPTEIICIDDGSTDGGKELIKKLYSESDSLRLYSHKNNKGLFQARMTAIKHVRGKYIGFVDSDDYVSKDYFQELYRIATETNADVAVGRIMNVPTEGTMYTQTRCLNFPYGSKEEGQSYYDLYWKQAGSCYPWHILWNKIYNKDLWTKNIKTFRKMHADITMLEDFIYSSIILSNAKAFTSASDGFYYYVQSGEASTSQDAVFEKWEKNIQDMGIAFDIVKGYLSNDKRLCIYLEYLSRWKERYSRYWFRNICDSNLAQKEKDELKDQLKNRLHIAELEMPSEEDEYYYAEAEFY